MYVEVCLDGLHVRQRRRRHRWRDQPVGYLEWRRPRRPAGLGKDEESTAVVRDARVEAARREGVGQIPLLPDITHRDRSAADAQPEI